MNFLNASMDVPDLVFKSHGDGEPVLVEDAALGGEGEVCEGFVAKPLNDVKYCQAP